MWKSLHIKSYPKDIVPSQGKCIKYCVYPNKNMCLYVSCKKVEPSETHLVLLYNSTLKLRGSYP